MDREQAKEYIKAQLEDYLHSKGINTKKPFRCLNPEHEDSTPSMNYDKKRKKAHCFGCGADYDTLDLIAIDYNLHDTGEVFKKAYEIYHVAPDGGTYQKQPGIEQYTHNNIHKESYTHTDEPEPDYTSFYRDAHTHIKDTGYAKRRGLSDEVINRFNLGYVEMWKHPKAPAGVSPTPRLIIPTSPHSYLARDTRENLSEKEKDFAKMKVGAVRIFNADILEKAQKPIFVTEGEIDALSIMSVGGEAIATGSTSNIKALTALMINKRPAQPLIVAMDNDERGNLAAQQLEEELKEMKIPFYRMNLYGNCKDANEALQADKAALENAVVEAEQVEMAAQEIKKREYLHTSAAYHIEAFINGIQDSANTPYTPTGFSKLDEVLDGGLYEGLYIIGAISSLGKTSWVTQVTDQMAQGGQDILIFSLEMSRAEIMAKSISRHTVQIAKKKGLSTRNAKTTRGITTWKRYQGYSKKEIDLINEAVQTYGTYAKHIYISEGLGDIGAAQVRNSVQEHIAFTGNRPVVVVDYLQILAPHNERATDKQNTDKSVTELKRISRDFKIPVLAISSFNRNNYSVPVTMEAFKESGAVEYSSDILIGLQLAGTGAKNFDPTVEKKRNPRNIELVVLKNRNGRVGDTIEFKYYPLFNHFEEQMQLEGEQS